MLHAKSQGNWSSGSGEEDILNRSDHILAWWPSWSGDQTILHTFWLKYHKVSLHEIGVQLG